MASLIPSKARPAPPWAARRAGEDYGAHASPDWRDIDWREHLRATEIDGRSVNYADIGESSEGPPVIFIHGLGGCWQNWLENIPRVAAEGRRAIAVDLPGFGFSEMPSDKITISGYGRTIERLSEVLGLGPSVLVGNSMGGFISAECAIQSPERVERIVLVSSAGISTTSLHRRPLMVGTKVAAAVGMRMAASSDTIVRHRRLRQPLYGMIMRHPQRIPTDLLYEVTQASTREGFVPAMEALASYDFRDRLPEIRSPALIIQGADDMIVPAKDADEFERLIPNARKVVLEDTGHTAMIERPPTFNDLLIEFISDEPQADAPRQTKERADLAAAGGDGTAGERSG